MKQGKMEEITNNTDTSDTEILMNQGEFS